MSTLSLNPEGFTEGGGLVDDVDGIIKESLFVAYDYNGKSKDPAPCIKLTVDVDGDEHTQYYSMGTTKDWIPSEDGKQLIKAGSANSIRLTSNGGIFLKALVDAGFPTDKLGDDITVLEGVKAHFIQIPEPERKGITRTKEQQDKIDKWGPKTILVVSEIIELPWDKKEAKTKKTPGSTTATKSAAAPTKTATKTATKETDDSADDVATKATEWVMEFLGESGSVAKKDLPTKIFKEKKDDPDKNAVIKLVFTDEFLSSGPWNFDGSELSM